MSEQAAKRVPIIAMGFSVVALVVVLIAVVVVMNRGTTEIAAAKTVEPALAPIDRRVAAADVVRLDNDDMLVPAAGGVRIKDPELAKQLGLTVDDLIASISGRPVSRQFDVHEVIFNTSMMKATTLYVELADRRIVRWQLDGDLRTARYAIPPSYAGLGGYPTLPSAVASDPLLDTIEKVDDTHYTVPTATLAAVLAAPAKFVTTARVVPAMKNGHPDGLKLYAIRPSSVFAHIGLQNGDTIQTINGNDLGDLSKALDSYAKLKVAHSFVIELARRGRPLTITITEK